MTSMKWLSIACLLLSLAGCATSGTAPNRYTLPDDAARGVTDSTMAGADAERQLRITTPRLARFLDSDGIVLQLDDITLNEANHHQWAEPLGLQLERGLRARLAARLPDTRIVDQRTPTDAVSMTLELDIFRFHGRFDGMAVAAGQWQLRDADGNLMALTPFNVEVILESDGYPALVRALGRAWDEVADRLAEAIRELR